jgi:hypothetical protein
MSKSPKTNNFAQELAAPSAAHVLPEQLLSISDDRDSVAAGVTWIAPFTQSSALLGQWDSGSYGDAEGNKIYSFIKKDISGILELIHQGVVLSASDRMEQQRHTETWVMFGYVNPYATGRLEITADLFITNATISSILIDEVGFSDVHTLIYQRLLIDVFKKFNGQPVRTQSFPTSWHEYVIDVNSGDGDHSYSNNKNERPVRITVTTTNDVERGVNAYIGVGLWSGWYYSTNDYQIEASAGFKVRLEKVTVRTV